MEGVECIAVSPHSHDHSLYAEDSRESFSNRSTEEGRDGIANLFDDLRAVAGELEVIVEGLKSSTFSRGQRAITRGVNAAVRSRVDEIHGNGDAGRVAVEPTVTRRETTADQVAWNR